MTSLSVLRQWPAHKRTLALALPMIFSNVTTPLLGLVDTAVIGHLSEVYYLGGVAVGAMIITLLFWLLGFLRMATTGLVAQGYGKQDWPQQLAVLWQGLCCALTLATLLLLVQTPLLEMALWLIGGSVEVQHYALEYAQIRIWGAPAALMNLVLLGFLLGRQQAKAAMWLLVCANSFNIVLDLWLVIGFEWGVTGAAAATVIADYCALALALFLSWRQIPINYRHLALLNLNGIGKLIALNRDIFLRSLCLQLCIAFVTAQGARMGDSIVAANSVLMNFTLLIAYALDGFAYSAEAQVGQAIGADDKPEAQRVVSLCWVWSGVTAVAFSGVFLCAGDNLIGLLTDLPSVQSNAQQYLPWLVLYPLVSFTCFLFDGVYIGAAKGRAMRNSMLLSASGFFLFWWLTQSWHNHGLWFAFCGFAVLRSITLIVYFYRQSFWSVRLS
ncbi:MATE family efflux transporter DinF [Ferrimonas lipolytica]|uniref:MATE family efflux transporter DinF n=1 Tax=Ferrimonas lipolytica TaxID=2724191 RepID=A0A6H1UH15_9GAMM|nr:MATE family efflux transporter DinF [Ferrimonas lipolytica]QIZ78397.1 MATE family efflux transporter DinF [Ferrimonas lipolytica]